MVPRHTTARVLLAFLGLVCLVSCGEDEVNLENGSDGTAEKAARINENEQAVQSLLGALLAAEEEFFKRADHYWIVGGEDGLIAQGLLEQTWDGELPYKIVEAAPGGQGPMEHYHRETWTAHGYRFEHFVAHRQDLLECYDFYCIAAPVRYGEDGEHSYFLSHEGKLRREKGKRAGAKSPLVE